MDKNKKMFSLIIPMLEPWDQDTAWYIEIILVLKALLHKEIFKEWIIFRWALDFWRLIESANSCYNGWHSKFEEVRCCWWKNLQENRRLNSLRISCSQMYLQNLDGSQVLPAGQKKCSSVAIFLGAVSHARENRPTLLTYAYLLTCLCTFKHSLSVVGFFFLFFFEQRCC